MIILDTDVLSELIRPSPHPSVVEWVDEQLPADLAITAVTAAELRAGVARMPEGRRKRDIDARIEFMITNTFDGHVLPFDGPCSVPYAAIVTRRSGSGHPIAFQDAQIAAITRWHGSALATRNVDDFAETGIDVINPWPG